MTRRIFVPPLFAVLFLLVLFVGMFSVNQNDVQAQSAGTRYVTVVNTQTLTQSLTTSSVNYGAQYAKATIFVTADISGTGSLIVTPQVSFDGENWANALRFVPDTTNGTLDELAVSKTLSADGTAYFMFDLEMPYIRYTVVPSGTIQTTIKVMYQ
jgi:hypothetical protein